MIPYGIRMLDLPRATQPLNERTNRLRAAGLNGRLSGPRSGNGATCLHSTLETPVNKPKEGESIRAVTWNPYHKLCNGSRVGLCCKALGCVEVFAES